HFGIEVKYDDSRGYTDTSSALKNLYADVELYCSELLHTKEGEVARNYLTRRGFEEDIITRFKLGYMPKFPEVERFKSKYGEELLEQSGIFFKGKGSMFRERLIIPIHSVTGSCIALSGRALLDAENRKYINSPETPIFMKRKVLYNFDNAVNAIKKNRSCYIVEGYFDVIRMAAAGFENCVAMMGTAVTRERFSQLSRHAEEFNLLLDGDAAGAAASEHSYEAALEADVYPNIIQLPAGEDPDTFIVKNGGDALRNLEKRDLIEYLIHRKLDEATDINTKYHRLDDVRHMLEKVKDPYRREHYINLTSKIFEVNINTLSADIGSDVPQIRTYSGKKQLINNITEKRFLTLLLELPEESADKITAEVPPEYIEDETARKIYEKFIELASEEDVIPRLAADELLGGAVADLFFSKERRSIDIFAEIYDCKNRILLTHYEKRNSQPINLEEFAQNTEIMKELKAKLKKAI
ncbi:MAG: toprim domain-containing protein, partial [Deferribacteraceae bacterium]|nr:toprim domain-containing protein [Deferribacteraceae bacterium]